VQGTGENIWTPRVEVTTGSRRLRIDVLCNLYSSSDIITVIKLRREICGVLKDAYKVSVGKPE
jgi:hypothetical protein